MMKKTLLAAATALALVSTAAIAETNLQALNVIGRDMTTAAPPVVTQPPGIDEIPEIDNGGGQSGWGDWEFNHLAKVFAGALGTVVAAKLGQAAYNRFSSSARAEDVNQADAVDLEGGDFAEDEV